MQISQNKKCKKCKKNAVAFSPSLLLDPVHLFGLSLADSQCFTWGIDLEASFSADPLGNYLPAVLAVG